MDILGLIIFIGLIFFRASTETRRKQEQTRRPPANVHPAPVRPPVTTRPIARRPAWPQAPPGPFGGPTLPRPDRPMAPVPLPWEETPTMVPAPSPVARRRVFAEGEGDEGWMAPERDSRRILAEGEGTEGAYQTLQGRRLSGFKGEGDGSEGEGVMEGFIEEEPRYRQPEPVRLAKPAKLEPVLFAPGYNGNDVLRGVVMAEILAPPRSRRPRSVRPAPGVCR